MSSMALGKKPEPGDPYASPSYRNTPSGSRHASPSHQKGKASPSATRETPEPRNIDRVLYGNYDIKTWYHSPYPLANDDESHLTKGTVAKRNMSPSPLRAANGPSKRTKTQHHHALAGDATSLEMNTAVEASPCSSRMSSPSGSRRKEIAESCTRVLWVCDGCLKYMNAYNDFSVHKKLCTHTHPPGRKVYQRGAHIIWEVDGAQEKLYCQNLSLFGKLFIDHKTIYFDVEPFLFYVLTDAASAKIDHPLGFFSKEKLSYDDYNLACIITFPPYQRKSFGTLMIEFSYVLSAAQNMLGTPERPLSDLGLKGYLSFWTAVLLRTLKFCFDGKVLSNPVPARSRKRATSTASAPSLPLSQGTDSSSSQSVESQQEAGRKLKLLQMRCQLLNLPMTAIEQPGLSELRLAAGAPQTPKRKIRLKGWAGSTPGRPSRTISNIHSLPYTNGDGTISRPSQALHAALDLSHLEEPVTMETTLEAIASLTRLRPDDVAMALTEAGLFGTHAPVLDGKDPALTVPSKRNGQPNHILLLTEDAISAAITKFNVRPAVLDEDFVLL